MTAARVYADHNATAPLRPEVLEAMRPFLSAPGNAASPHAHGRTARAAVEAAREHVAALVGAAADGVVFTSGGTESIHLALLGSIAGRKGARIVTTAAEHHAVLALAAALERQGEPIVRVPVDAAGVVDEAAWQAALSPGAAVASVLWVNNETGVRQELPRLAAVATARGVRVHADAVSAPGRERIDLTALGVDLLSLSAHKFGGPQGVGALVLAPGVSIAPMFHGGGQESGRRAGTTNVAGVVGMGEAARLVRAELEASRAHVARLTAAFEATLSKAFPDVVVHGTGAARSPGTSAFSIPGTEADVLLVALDLAGVSVSSGAACTTGSVAPSHVLVAMGVTDALAHAALRVSFGAENDASDPPRIVAALAQAVAPTRR